MKAGWRTRLSVLVWGLGPCGDLAQGQLSKRRTCTILVSSQLRSLPATASSSSSSSYLSLIGFVLDKISINFL